MIYSANLQRALGETERQREIAEASAIRSRQLLYATEIRHAREAWQKNNVAEVLQTLDRQRPVGQEVDVREFSWYYLRGLCEQQLLTMRGHRGDVFGIAWSADGRILPPPARTALSVYGQPPAANVSKC